MFDSCKSLVTLDISDWNTGNITTMASMFKNCNELYTLSEIDASKNTSGANTYDSPLYGCYVLRNFGGFNG